MNDQETKNIETRGNIIPIFQDETVKESETDNVLNEENPLSADNIRNIEGLIKNTEMLVQIMRDQWAASIKELGITDDQIKEISKYNKDHYTAMPEGLSDEEKENWDNANGIDNITDEEITRIFGEDHPIYGVDHSQTVDRIKGAYKDFSSYLEILREYTNLNNAYMQLVELEEENSISQLKEIAEKETDPVKKANMLANIDDYYERKYLGFLAKPFDAKTKKRLLEVLSSPGKIMYWLERSRAHLKSMKISQKFILEISQFEKRFLDEKYHKANNLLLLYFMNTAGYAKDYDPKDENTFRTKAMVLALDPFIRNIISDDKKKIILDNIIAFEDQFIDSIKEPIKDDTIAPPVNPDGSIIEQSSNE